MIEKATLNLEDFVFEDAENEAYIIQLVCEAIDFVKDNHEVSGRKDLRSGAKLKPQDYIASRLGKTYNATKLSHYRSYSKRSKHYFTERIKCLKLLQLEFDLVYYRESPYVSGSLKESSIGIKGIAEKLALNLVDVSSRLQDTLPYQEILKEKRLWKNRIKGGVILRERIIAIVGAGGSNAATPKKGGIPTSADALKRIKSAFDGKMAKKLVEESLEDINSQLGSASSNDFERNMKALIRLSPRRVINKLKEQCGYRQTPSLLYELLAHLLKHRFLDAIINFNYDELLDNAIEEELPNKDDYRFIYTAGHCPETLSEISINNRIKHPIYRANAPKSEIEQLF